MQEKAANVGFDWESPEDVWAKVKEEIAEFEEELERSRAVSGKSGKPEPTPEMLAEYGDLLFSLVNAVCTACTPIRLSS